MQAKSRKSTVLNELVQFGRLCRQEGLVIASGGNISVRIKDMVYIKKEAVHLGQATSKDFISIKTQGGFQRKFKEPRPSAEFRMHLACFKTRPDIGAIVHTHPIYSTALANTGADIGGFTYELTAVMNSGIRRIKYVTPGTMALAREVAKAIRDANGLLLVKHGIITVGRDLREAFDRSLALERTAKVFILSALLKST